MRFFNSILAFFLGMFLMLGLACKKKNDLVISMDSDTIFVNQEVRFLVNVDFKVKEEEWKILETNTSFSNVGAAAYKFPAKGIYTIQYSAQSGIFKKVNAQKKVIVYALSGTIKNYWNDESVIHGDISLWVKGTRYDGKHYEDSVFFGSKNGITSTEDCEYIYEPKVFLNVPGGRYKCFLRYKYYYQGTIWVEHADSVLIDGSCVSFNY